MITFGEEFLDEIRRRVDLLDLIGSVVRLKRAGQNWMGLCPFHHEKTPSFGVRPDRGFFKCFGCGESGDAFGFLIKHKGLSFPEAVEELAGRVGLALPTAADEDPAAQRRRAELAQLLEITRQAKGFFREQLAGNLGGSARHYLERRGVAATTIERFELGYAPRRGIIERFGPTLGVEALERVGLVSRREPGAEPYDRFRDRVIFPIHDLQGRCVGFGGRALAADAKPKYLNSPETPLYHKGELLYGLHLAQESIRRQASVVVVEGYMDLITLAQAGEENVVAAMGTAFTAAQLGLLWQRGKRVVFCFDGDNAGRQAAWRALERVIDGLRGGREATFLFLPAGMDPDQLIRAEGVASFNRHLAEALPLHRFLFDHLAAQERLEVPEGRVALVGRLRHYLDQIAEPLLRQLYAAELEPRVGLNPGQLLGVAPVAASPEPPVSSPPAESAYPRPVRVEPAARWRGGRGREWSRQGVSRQGSRLREGRDFERVLLALVLQTPELVREFEEELGTLELQGHGRLLEELLKLAARLPPPIAEWPWELLSPEFAATARELMAEPVAGDCRVELRGCIASHQLRGIRAEMLALSSNPDLNERELAAFLELKREEGRLLGNKG